MKASLRKILLAAVLTLAAVPMLAGCVVAAGPGWHHGYWYHGHWYR